jgi:hypothetical protein
MDRTQQIISYEEEEKEKIDNKDINQSKLVANDIEISTRLSILHYV